MLLLDDSDVDAFPQKTASSTLWLVPATLLDLSKSPHVCDQPLGKLPVTAFRNPCAWWPGNVITIRGKTHLQLVTGFAVGYINPVKVPRIWSFPKNPKTQKHTNSTKFPKNQTEDIPQTMSPPQPTSQPKVYASFESVKKLSDAYKTMERKLDKVKKEFADLNSEFVHLKAKNRTLQKCFEEMQEDHEAEETESRSTRESVRKQADCNVRHEQEIRKLSKAVQEISQSLQQYGQPVAWLPVRQSGGQARGKRWRDNLRRWNEIYGSRLTWLGLFEVATARQEVENYRER